MFTHTCDPEERSDIHTRDPEEMSETTKSKYYLRAFILNGRESNCQLGRCQFESDKARLQFKFYRLLTNLNIYCLQHIYADKTQAALLLKKKGLKTD